MTLTQAATITKRSVNAFIVLIVLSIVGIIGYNIWYQYYLAHQPQVEEQPEIKFGVLPKLIFPPSIVSSANFSYSIDTETGNLPETPKMLRVYFIPRSGLTLLAPEKSKELAAKLKFLDTPEIISQTVYKYSDAEGGFLSIDLPTGNFLLQKNASANSNLITTSSAQIIENSQIKQELLVDLFKKTLTEIGFLPKEIAEGKAYINISKESSESAKISLLPADFEKTPIITALKETGLINANINLLDSQTIAFTKIDYTFWPIDITTSSTYPIKTSLQALEDLKSGKGFIVIEPLKPNVSITSANLVYFETKEYAPYLQPVYLFEGPNFEAIVPAISN